MPHQQHSHPRKYGKDSRACRCCTNSEGLIRKYELMICRRCFREQAAQIGFKKLRWTQCDLYTKVTICDATNCAWSKSLRPAIYLYRPESPPSLQPIHDSPPVPLCLSVSSERQGHWADSTTPRFDQDFQCEYTVGFDDCKERSKSIALRHAVVR